MKNNKKYIDSTIFQKVDSSKWMFFDGYEKQEIINIIKKYNLKIIKS